MRNAVIMGSILAVVAMGVFAADHHSSRLGHKRSSTVVDQPWAPEPYPEGAGRLPPSYAGIDAEKFLDHFKWKSEGLRKGEYETQDEFARRSADKDAILAPITTGSLYAFKVNGIHATYDADLQAYAFVNSGIACSKTPVYDKHPGYVSCTVTTISNMTRRYTGANAFGASATVTEVRQRNFGLAIPESHPAVSAILSSISFIPGSYEYRDKVQVPLDSARSLKNRTLAVLFVGRVTDAFIVDGRTTRSSPTIGSPVDSVSWVESAPFDLKRVVYYVVETGEIIGNRDF